MGRPILAVAAFHAALAVAASAEILTLAEAESIAIRNHPRVAAARLNAEASREAEKQVKSDLRPLLSTNFTGAVADHNTVIGAGQLQTSALFSRTAGGINISQTVYDFGRTSSLAAAARSRASAQSETANAVRAEILLQVRQAYYGALLGRAQVRIAKETVDTRRLIVKQISALVSSNLRSTLDSSFAELSLAEAELALDRAENEYRTARVQLTAAMGRNQESEFELNEEPLPAELQGTLDAAVAEALRNRPELAALRLQEEAARRFADSERRQALPSLTATGVGGALGFRDPRLDRTYSSFGMNLNIPILNGNLFSSRRHEADIRAQVATQETRDLELRISRDLRAAWIDATNALHRLAVAAKVVEHATRTMRLAQTRYDLGLATIVELTQAQLSRTSADFASAAARYEYMLKRFTVDYQSGLIH
jgi:outer membrane protein